jgi:hypothetical protein
MAGVSTGLKKKLTIFKCNIVAGMPKPDDSKKFEVMLNPTSYKQNKTVSYCKEEAIGEVESDPSFYAVNPKKLDFSIIIDGTGVVNLPIPGVGSPDVQTKIDQLNKIVYEYKGDKHEPNRLMLVWSSLKFFGRLESMTINYTLFAPGGKPLRAEIGLSFVSFLTAEQEEKIKNKNSPDMSHIVTIKAGDTLPDLCYRIYGDGTYYMQVARKNKLTHFRALSPGTTLIFPPLR